MDQPTNQVVRMESPGVPAGGAIAGPLSVKAVTERLSFVKEVMRNIMVDGQDYGKVPGCGPKPTLLQPGAQKLCLTFQLNSEVREEKVIDMPDFHRECSIIVRVSTPAGKYADGVGVCSTMESKYRFRTALRKCPECGQPTIMESKKEYGGGFFCNQKSGGCGKKFPADNVAISSQRQGRTEHDNPPDFWNTIRKMAFKRAYVHAVINFTNTSDLWTGDLEDMAENDKAVKGTPTEESDYRAKKVTEAVDPSDWRNVVLHFGKNKGVKLGDLKQDSLSWYQENFKVKEYPEGSGKFSAADIALRDALDESMETDKEPEPAAVAGGPDDKDNLPFD